MRRYGLPFTDRSGWWYLPLAPVLWLAVAVLAWAGGKIGGQKTASRGDRAGWTTLAVVLFVVGLVGPDSLGDTHGHYLPQRVILLALATLVPAFDLDVARLPGRAAVAALVIAIALQSAIIWDYALYADQSAGQIIGARDLVGKGRRVVTVLAATRSRFRANPLLHAEDWLGVDTGNIVWHNYETLYYYFPVQFRPGIKRPLPNDLERISLREDASQATERVRDWERILTEYADTIDVVVMWKRDKALEAVSSRWFDRVERRGDVQVFSRSARGHSP